MDKIYCRRGKDVYVLENGVLVEAKLPNLEYLAAGLARIGDKLFISDKENKLQETHISLRDCRKALIFEAIPPVVREIFDINKNKYVKLSSFSPKNNPPISLLELEKKDGKLDLFGIKNDDLFFICRCKSWRCVEENEEKYVLCVDLKSENLKYYL